MKKVLLIGIILLGYTLQGQSLNDFLNKTGQLLKQHVSNGKIDYAAIKSDPALLEEALSIAESVTVSSNDQHNFQAFWINAYNVAVIKGIVDHYPTNSPLDIKGFFDKTTYALAGKKITLNDIENKQLRAKFDDARFHFVLVCAGVGCPPIIPGAYKPESLDSQLTQQTKLAINDPKFLKVNDKKKRVQFSQIMEWYHEDFTQKGQSLIDFANKYREQPIPANYKTSYYAYDWRLNSK